ncbi:MAG: universal stress protein [Pararhodobacter sp.]
MPFASVIAATDLTALSAQVPGRARLLAQGPGARVVLTHVRPADRKRPPRATAESKLAALGLTSGADELQFLIGDPAEELTALALAAQAGLVVLGLHRKRRVLDLLRLTTMERIVLAAPCPVLIAQLPPARPYRQVLLATDFSPASAAALIAAATLAPEAEFHAIHALQVPLVGDAEAAMASAEEARAEFLAMPGLPPLAEPPEIIPGGVHPVLQYRLDELDADLLCLGAASSEDGLGVYVRDLVRAPPTDVLVARAPVATPVAAPLTGA